MRQFSMHQFPSLIMSTILTSTLLATSAAAAPQVLLQPWSGPYGGVPPFDKASPALLGPALEAGMA